MIQIAAAQTKADLPQIIESLSELVGEASTSEIAFAALGLIAVGIILVALFARGATTAVKVSVFLSYMIFVILCFAFLLLSASKVPQAADVIVPINECELKQRTINLKIKTSDKKKAGTDGLLTGFSSDTCGNEFQFSVDAKGGLLQQNTLYDSSISIAMAGDISNLRLTLEERGDSPGWHVGWVQLGEKCFMLNRWLASSNGSGLNTSVYKPTTSSKCR